MNKNNSYFIRLHGVMFTKPPTYKLLERGKKKLVPKNPKPALPLLSSLARQESHWQACGFCRTALSQPATYPSSLPTGWVDTCDKVENIHWSLPWIQHSAVETLVTSWATEVSCSTEVTLGGLLDGSWMGTQKDEAMIRSFQKRQKGWKLSI